MGYTTRQIDIIKAATVLIGEHGVNGLTTKKLAQEMKFSEPALYRHFKNKDEILKSVLLYYKGDMKSFVGPILVGSGSGLEKIKLLFNFQFNHFKQNPAIVLVIFSETSFQNNKLLSETVHEIMEQKKLLMESIIEYGQLDNSIRKNISPRQLAIIIMGSMRLTILKWRLTDFSHDLDDIKEELWKTIHILIKQEQ